MWMDDPELLDVLGRMANVCVVVTKQPQGKYTRPGLEMLTKLAEESGLAQAAYSELAELAPRHNGRPLVVGPGSSSWVDKVDIGGVREIGFRRVGNRLVPIVHAKIMLLGRMGWTDEHPSGDVVDQLFFVPEKLSMDPPTSPKLSLKRRDGHVDGRSRADGRCQRLATDARESVRAPRVGP